MYSYGPPHMTKQKQDDQLERTYSSYVRIRDVALKTCQKRWMIGKSGERGSVRDIRATTWWYIYIYVYVCVCVSIYISGSPWQRLVNFYMYIYTLSSTYIYIYKWKSDLQNSISYFFKVSEKFVEKESTKSSLVSKDKFSVSVDIFNRYS